MWKRVVLALGESAGSLFETQNGVNPIRRQARGEPQVDLLQPPALEASFSGDKAFS
jgi:hypothetical protein